MAVALASSSGLGGQDGLSEYLCEPCVHSTVCVLSSSSGCSREMAQQSVQGMLVHRFRVL
jgi:hypothetical protein